MPGRVVWAYDPDSVEWDGNGYWWELSHFDTEKILEMVNESIASLGGKESAKDGWRALFAAHNRTRGRNGGYATGEKIAIKVNINGSAVMDDDTSGETKMSYTNPVLLKVLLTSMVAEAGVAPSDITVYDVSRLFPDYMVELCTEGILKGVRFVDRDTGVADKNAPSVFVSQDPVAIDSVGADFLMNEPAVTENNGALRGDPTVENYLHEAGLVADAPSGTVYTDGRGRTVTNLGVHEHWCNSTEKLYSRNLGKNEGIELISIRK